MKMTELFFFGVEGHLVDFPDSLRNPGNVKKLIGQTYDEEEGKWVPSEGPARVVLIGSYASDDRNYLKKCVLGGALVPANEETKKHLKLSLTGEP